MRYQALEHAVTSLATLPANDSPFLTCYADLARPAGELFPEIEYRAEIIRSALHETQRQDFDDALEETLRFITGPSVKDSSRGLAVYSRWGDAPFFLPLQFEAPLPTRLIAGTLPDIYHLIELKDRYHRFLVVISTTKEARILEIVAGSVSEELFKSDPALAERLGEEWAKELFHGKRPVPTQLLEEKIRILEEAVRERGYAHLILAGDHRAVSRLREALPGHLAERVVDTLRVDAQTEVSAVLRTALQCYLDFERKESHSAVEELRRSMLGDGLACIGIDASLEELGRDNVRLLLLAQNFELNEIRGEVIRLALQSDIPVETVPGNAILESFGGMGCLLKTRPEGPVPQRPGGHASFASASARDHADHASLAPSP